MASPVDVNFSFQPKTGALEDFGIRTNTLLKRTSPTLAVAPQVHIEPKPVAAPSPAPAASPPMAFAEPVASSTMDKLNVAETALQLVGLTAPLWLALLLLPSRR